ncbi:MAG: AAA family ATPase, partial [Spirochaetaceae bacterium]|nr:AAA family ATPase [Spirochaetaceae bacterium]
LISGHIQRVLPTFDRFQIAERYGKVMLRWKAVGSDKSFGPHLTSDGSLRFFALVTLLNLPGEMLPAVLLLDEPELGLHPAAVALIGGMIKSLAVERQIIVATQSPLLVDAFDLEEILVLDLEDGQTTFSRPDATGYGRWLEEGFMPGEMWQKNLIGGRP